MNREVVAKVNGLSDDRYGRRSLFLFLHDLFLDPAKKVQMQNTFEHKSLWVVWLILSFGLQACHYPWEPDPPAPENVLLDREFMDYVGLPDNSYWIYRNVRTGELDSSYIGVTDTQMVDLDFGRQKVEYLHEQRLGSLKLRGFTYLCEWYTTMSEKRVNEGEVKSNYFSLKNVSSEISKMMSYKEANRNWSSHDTYKGNIVTDYLDTAQLGGDTYSNVLHVVTGDSWEAKTAINHTYYAKGIGPVYRIFSDSSEWELVRYKLGEYVIPIGN